MHSLLAPPLLGNFMKNSWRQWDVNMVAHYILSLIMSAVRYFLQEILTVLKVALFMYESLFPLL